MICYTTGYNLRIVHIPWSIKKHLEELPRYMISVLPTLTSEKSPLSEDTTAMQRALHSLETSWAASLFRIEYLHETDSYIPI